MLRKHHYISHVNEIKIRAGICRGSDW